MDNAIWSATIYDLEGTALYTYEDYAFRYSATQIDSLVLVDNGHADYGAACAGTVTITNLAMEATKAKMSEPSVGDGSEDNPYQIGTAEELFWFANRVNNYAERSICAILTADIAINPGVFNTNGDYTPYASESVVEWTPIGCRVWLTDFPYKGTFDGQNHTISGLYYYEESYEYCNDIGLFGCVYDATIKNVNVTNSYFGGNSYIGGIVGYGEYSTITNCGNAATICGGGGLGGIAGNFIYGSIEKCVNYGKVIGSSDTVGGVAGWSYGTVNNCYNVGTVKGYDKAGGITGGGLDVINCYNAGAVTVTSSSGTISNITTEIRTGGSVENCYYLENNTSGGSIVNDGADYGTAVSAKTLASGEVAYLLQQAQEEQDTIIWGQEIGYEDYPSLYGQAVFYNSDDDTYYNLTSIAFENASLTLEVGDRVDLSTSLSPSIVQTLEIQWDSSNPFAATVSSSGGVRAIGVGTTVITAAVSGLTAVCVVTVTEKTTSVVWVSLDKTTLSLEEGETAQLSAEILPSDATNTNVTWESSDESVATVADGKVTAVSAGEAEITVTTEDGGYTAVCAVTVTAVVIPVTGVTLSSTTLSMTKGESAELTATVLPDNATDKTVTWESSDESVATVDDGIVTAVGRGTAVITASAGGFTAECEVTVSAPEVTVGSASAYAGENVTIPITIADNPGIAGFRFKITYDKDVLTPVSVAKGAVLTSGTLSSNIQQGGDMSSYEYIIAYYENTTNITSDGVILNVTFTVNSDAAEGETAVEITYEEGDVVTQNYNYVTLGIVNGAVNVKEVVHVTKVTLSETEAEMTVDENLTLTATVAPTNATYPAVTWESSDSSIATVKNGVVTALKTGSATITATADGVSAVCVVNVKPKYYADIAVEASSGYAGETVTVPIVISNNPGIAGFRVNIAYDTDVLTPVLVEKGDVLTEGTLTSNTASYEYIIAYYENTANITDDGVILYVTFAIDADAAEGETAIEITYEDGDVVTQNYEEVGLNITNGAVSVKEVVHVKTVTLSETEAEIAVDENLALTAAVAPTNATYPAVTWESSDESVATVSNGVVTALKTGSATITATADGVSASCIVNVKPKYYADIAVEASSGYASETVSVPIVISNNPGIAGFRLNIAYDTDVLTPVLVEKGDVLTEGTLTSNMSSYEYIIAYYENTANVTDDGVILYVTFAIDDDAAEGKTAIEITYEDGDVVTQDYEEVGLNITNGEIEVNRIVYVTGVKLDKSTNAMVKGESATLTAEVTPSDATYAGVTWASSDESVATVSNGVVTALKAGSAVITVTTEDGGFTASCTVTVTVPAESVELSETEITLIPGKTAEITAAVLPDDTTDTIVTWKSNDESIATVEDGIITAIAPGTATISATAGGVSASCTVTVREIMKGDVHDDSRVNAADGVRLRQYLAQWELDMTDYELAAADVNVDDSINAKDGVLLRRYLSGWSTTLSDMSLMGMSLFDENNLTIEVDNVTGKAGDYVDVPVMITNNPGVTAFNLLINFDKTALTPVSITAGDALTSGSIESNVNDTSIDLTNLDYVTVYYENVSNDYGTGVLCTVRFVISGDAEGTNEISLTLIEAYDEDLEDMEVDMTAGSVTVEGAVDTYYVINSVSSAGEISVTKEKPYNVGGVLIVAKYADGILIDKEIIEMSDMTDGETKVIQSSLTAGEGESLKAFIWKSVNDMRALSNVMK